MRLRLFFLFAFLSLLVACTSPTLTVATTIPSTTTPTVEPLDWWRNAVFYEIFVRSFYDSNGDGIGDFNGIAQKLNYLETLGIDAIWLMPIHPSPSYHGYDVLNYYAVNPDYGSMDDFKNLLNEAHERDIRIIIDLVINHTSSEHPWFKDANANPDSLYRDFYLWAESPGTGNWHQGQSGYYYGFFWSGMPDLNYNNPQVTDTMLKITDFWMNEVGVDGFRVDAVKHLIEENGKVENTSSTHDWLKYFYNSYKSQKPEAYAVGEVFGAGASVVDRYTGDELDQIFNFEISNGIMNSINGSATSGIVSAYKFAFMDMPDFNFAIFLTNHDQNRVMSVFNGNVEKAKMASFLMLTSPGTPYIYYGEEIGMEGKKPDEDIRLPMQWSSDENSGFTTNTPWRAVHSNAKAVNVALLEADSNSLLNHYKSLIHLRKSHPALQTGDSVLIETGNSSVFALLRESDSECILMLANLGNTSVFDYELNLSGVVPSTKGNAPITLFGESVVTSVETLNSYKPLDELLPYQMLLLDVCAN